MHLSSGHTSARSDTETNTVTFKRDQRQRHTDVASRPADSTFPSFPCSTAATLNNPQGPEHKPGLHGQLQFTLVPRLSLES